MSFSVAGEVGDILDVVVDVWKRCRPAACSWSHPELMPRVFKRFYHLVEAVTTAVAPYYKLYVFWKLFYHLRILGDNVAPHHDFLVVFLQDVVYLIDMLAIRVLSTEAVDIRFRFPVAETLGLIAVDVKIFRFVCLRRLSEKHFQKLVSLINARIEVEACIFYVIVERIV